jgi:hypothetical protein
MTRWVPFETDGAISHIAERLGGMVASNDNSVILRGDDGIFSVIRYSKETAGFFIYETCFPEVFKGDVTDLKSGDAIYECIEDGPIRSHRPNVNYPDTQEVVYFGNDIKDDFGKPQQVTILRGGQWGNENHIPWNERTPADGATYPPSWIKE